MYLILLYLVYVNFICNLMLNKVVSQHKQIIPINSKFLDVSHDI